jgi:hypothetical protein
MAGDAPDAAEQDPVKLRLFVSAVLPENWPGPRHLGALEDFVLNLTVSFDPALKNAS